MPFSFFEFFLEGWVVLPDDDDDADSDSDSDTDGDGDGNTSGSISSIVVMLIALYW